MDISNLIPSGKASSKSAPVATADTGDGTGFEALISQLLPAGQNAGANDTGPYTLLNFGQLNDQVNLMMNSALTANEQLEGAAAVLSDLVKVLTAQEAIGTEAFSGPQSPTGTQLFGGETAPIMPGPLGGLAKVLATGPTAGTDQTALLPQAAVSTGRQPYVTTIGQQSPLQVTSSVIKIMENLTSPNAANQIIASAGDPANVAAAVTQNATVEQGLLGTAQPVSAVVQSLENQMRQPGRVADQILPAVGGEEPSGRADQRLLAVLSLVVGTAASVVRNQATNSQGVRTVAAAGGKNLSPISTSPAGAAGDLLAVGASLDVSSFAALISEEELTRTLLIADRAAALQGKGPAEGSQSTRFAQVISKQIQSVKIGGDRTVVQLSPGGLGAIEIEVSTDEDGVLKVILRAENAMVLNAMRNDRETVLQALSQITRNNDATNLEFQEFNRQFNQSHDQEAELMDQGNVTSEDEIGEYQVDHTPLITSDRLDIVA